MNFAVVSILIAVILIYAAKIPLGFAMHKGDGYDNKHPRAQQARLTGWGARALAAHQNSFESFMPFAAGVLLALLYEVNTLAVNIACGLFLVSRVVYLICYWANWDYARTSFWTIGFGASLYLIASPLFF